jgi:hypothetical protein
MPIFEDALDDERPVTPDLANQPSKPISIPRPLEFPLARKLSEESIRTELCEGPIPDTPPLPSPDDADTQAHISDRAELIERLKRGESPTWVPNRHVRVFHNLHHQCLILTACQLESLFHLDRPRPRSRSPQPPSHDSLLLLPAADITPEKKPAVIEDVEAEKRLKDGQDLERPRSALHSGDFTQQLLSPQGLASSRGSLPVTPEKPFHSNSRAWIATSPPRHYTPFGFDHHAPQPARRSGLTSGPSSLSSSLSSSFIYKPPTSPLVQSESNDDAELAFPMHNIDITASSPRNPRRHTLASHNSSPFAAQSAHRQIPGLRREGTHPYQAHQPRRSLTSTPLLALNSPSPQMPTLLRSRRPSFSSDTSPSVQHASMVGSYEESILRGRMSTTPSKPLDFLAKIGVLGLGKCKASLRCPAHVTLPFSAVFYSYATTPHGRSKAEDGPSPYVGQIDLENGLPNPEDDLRAKRKQQSRTLARQTRDDDMDLDAGRLDVLDAEAASLARQKRRSNLPKAPPGGSYRIPEKGQLQIIIKNQNNTAVKLFLVPYDLAGMEPGTKTFVRQRSYSAGPIVDNLPSEADRPVLRYLVHLHICCPSRGRYYLYKSIRVVFANRVPDGKEKLQNEVTFPEPRFTPYKAIRVMHPPVSVTTGPGASLAAEKAFRRRSSGFAIGGLIDRVDMPPPLPARASHHGPSLSFSGGPINLPIQPVPFHASGTRTVSSGSDATTVTQLRSPRNGSGSGGRQADDSPVFGMGDVSRRLDGLEQYSKLSKGDVGYGGNAFVHMVNGSPGTEGLLSLRLRLLGVQGQAGGAARQESEGDRG